MTEKRIKLDPAHHPDATALGRKMLEIAANDAASVLTPAGHLSPLGRDLRRIARGSEFIARGAINTGLGEIDAGIAALQAQGLLIPKGGDKS